MKGKYGVLVAFLVLLVAFWRDQQEWGAAAFGFLVLVAMIAGVVVLWRMSGIGHALTFRRDR